MAILNLMRFDELIPFELIIEKPFKERKTENCKFSFHRQWSCSTIIAPQQMRGNVNKLDKLHKKTMKKTILFIISIHSTLNEKLSHN